MGSENQINGSQSPPRVPHVVVVPYPSQGHINPLLQFAKRLSSHGVKVTFAAANAVTALSVSVEPIFGGGLSSSPAVGEESDFLSSLESKGSEGLTRLIEKHARTDSPVCCVVYDAFLPWALDVARAHGVRGAAFFTNSATVSVLFSMVHGGRLAVPLDVEEARKAVPEVTWEARDLPSFLRRPESYPAYLEMKLSQFGNLEFADWVFCNSFDDLESEEMRRVREDGEGVVGRAELGARLEEVMVDGDGKEEMRRNVVNWKELAKKAMSKEGSSSKYIGEFVKELSGLVMGEN